MSHVKEWGELAQALGVTERGLHKFRARHECEIESLGEELTRDGLHDVDAWRELGEKHGELVGRTERNQNIDAVSEKELRLMERKAKVDREQLKLAKERGELVPEVEYRQALAKMLSDFDAALKQLSQRCVERVVTEARQSVLSLVESNVTDKQFERLKPAIEEGTIDHIRIASIIDAEVEICRGRLFAAESFQDDEADE